MSGAAIGSRLVKARGTALVLLVAMLVGSCVVYTPDLLNDDAVSLGGGPTPNATTSPAPALAAPSAPLVGTKALITARAEPNHLGALVAPPTDSTHWRQASALPKDGGASEDGGAFADAGAP